MCLCLQASSVEVLPTTVHHIPMPTDAPNIYSTYFQKLFGHEGWKQHVQECFNRTIVKLQNKSRDLGLETRRILNYSDTINIQPDNI